MKQAYEIPSGSAPLEVGSWVEIFEAYGDVDGKDVIRVRSLRIDGKLLSFGRKGRLSPAGRPLRPHEGQIVHLENDASGTRFNLRLTARPACHRHTCPPAEPATIN